MTQYTMARNSSDYLSGKPDIRTGLFAKTLTLASLKGNYNSGPTFKLQVCFNPQQDFMNFLTPFGSGWGLSISAFLRSTSYGDGHLTLPSGKSFYIPTLSGGMEAMEGYLLSDIQIYWDKIARILTVTQKSGDTHYYRSLSGDEDSGNLYIYQTTSAEGRSLYFTYSSNQFSIPSSNSKIVCLTRVEDDAGVALASVDYSYAAGNGTVVTIASNNSSPRQFRFMQINNTLDTVFGPENYKAVFTYYNNLADGGIPMFMLSSVADTSGLYETVIYSSASNPASGGIMLPGGTMIQNTVQEYRRAGDLTATDGSTDYVATFSFTQPSANQYNYLGNPVIHNSQVDERKDSLLHYTGEFSYTSTLTEQLTRLTSSGAVASPVNKVTTTTYNKFHSVVEKVVTYDEGVHIVTESFTYAATDGDITQQIPTYALPLKHTKTWSYGSVTATETQSFSWDNFGNLTHRTDKTGTTTTRDYYAASGETGCPADPYGFVRHLKTKTIAPGTPSAPNLPAAPVRRYDYAYGAVPGYNSVSVIRRTGMEQYENKDTTPVLKKSWGWMMDANLLTAARLASTSVTLPATDGEKTTSITINYSLLDDNSTQRTVSTCTGYDGLQRKRRIDHDVITGKIMATADITVSESTPALTMHYKYDDLGRMTQKTTCQGSQFEASQSYSFTPSTLERGEYAPIGNPAKTTTNAYGIKNKSITDSANHLLEQWLQDADAIVSQDTQSFYLVNSTRYDGAGNCLSTVSKDYYPNNTSSTALSVSLYDEWGKQCATVAPDGHIEISQHDPLTRTTYTSLIGTDQKEVRKQRVTEDVAGNPLKTERLNADGSVYSTEVSDYDGLGRRVRITDATNHQTLITWDTFDRPSTVTRADGSVINPSWAPHSTDTLMTGIMVAEHSMPGADEYIYGIREFDSLNRVTKMSVGERQSIYTYSNGSATKPTTIKTPAGATLVYTYQPELNDIVLSVSSDASGDEAYLTYTYNPITGSMLTSNSDIAPNDYVHRSLRYTPSGQLSQDTLSYQLKGGEQTSRSQVMTYSLGNNPVTTTDATGLTHIITYDQQGRQAGYDLTPTPSDAAATVSSVTYRYDSIGRSDQTTAIDKLSGNVHTTTLTWDDHGRELQRTLTLNGSVSAQQEQVLTYNLNNQITTRNTTRNGQPLRTEAYEYTALRQMLEYTCTGDYPYSPNGYRLAGQQFTFDFIGNIRSVVSHLLDPNDNPVTNTATYTVSDTDRTQLTEISNDAITNWDLTLSYDDNGNMTTDEQSHRLNYNSRNQLMDITDAKGQLLGWYCYDADGIQIAEKKEADTEAVALYYQSSGVLINEIQGSMSSTYIDTLACIVRNGSESDTVQLLGCDQQNSVIQISDDSEVAWKVYAPYGYSK